MAKLNLGETLQRCLQIIKYFEANGNTEIHLDDIYKNVMPQNGLTSEDSGKRTLKNYFTYLHDLGYKVESGKKKGTYTLTTNNKISITDVIDNFLIINSFNKQVNGEKFIFTGFNEYRGTEHFFSLREAILGNFLVRFSLTDFITSDTNEYCVEPYALKENRGRWYLLGVKHGTMDRRACGLDRMSNLIVESETFNPIPFDWEEYYRDCYAMFNPDKPAERVVVSFDERDANYVRSKPIHHSQKELLVSDGRVRFELKIKITEDFTMELMSRAWSIQVHEPEHLRNTLKQFWADAIERNSK